jgi:D-alanyl-D-alanine carboxypeptidase
MHRRVVVGLTLGLAGLLAGCGTDGSADRGRTSPPTAPPSSSDMPSSSDVPSSSSVPSDLPIEAFAKIVDDMVSDEVAAELQAALNEMSGLSDGTGMSATVLSADGIWSGTVGKADGVRDLRVDDQFAIASGTKPVVAAQIMQMVEAGLLGLDDPVADRLPPDLGFDTNEATIRHLLSHRSGLPDYEPTLLDEAVTDPSRRWTAEELLTLVPAGRQPVDRVGEYSSTNYLLLQLVIEHVTGRPLSAVLRDGVLDLDGIERIVYQPDEVPTEPMALPFGGTLAAFDEGGGYLPSLANASGGGGAWGIASDSPSLAHWWRAMCSGEIVSQDSLTEMTPTRDDYGLGIYRFPGDGALALGHPGVEVGYRSWSACLPADGTVIVVLANGEVPDLFGLGRPLIAAAESLATDETMP